MIAAGIDCGARNAKAVILRDGRVIGKGIASTGYDPRRAAAESLDEAMQRAGVGRGEIRRICATGSGRDSVAGADGVVDDIRAMAKGAFFHFPRARTVADVGAEEGRAAKLDELGNVVDFAVNEKCAAGAGAFIGAMARALDLSIEEMGRLGLQSGGQIPMNVQCVVFAEAEVVGLIHAGTPRADISKAIHDSVAGRIVSLIRRIGFNPELALIGGLAHNPGFLAAMSRQLKIENICVPADPEFGAALGAAVCAAGEFDPLAPL